MLRLGSIFRKHGVSFYCYADDTQIYRPLESNNKDLDPLLACLADVKAWMSLNFLHLNEGKTEIIVFESSDVACSSGLNLDHLSSCVKPVVKNLRVYFDSALSIRFEQ